jgi:methylated-DNA-[protein]-cysteine S-methyltransferase
MKGVQTMTESADNRIIDVFETDLGWIGVLTHGQTLQRVTFGHETAAEAKADLRKSLDDVSRIPAKQAIGSTGDSADWRRQVIGQLAAYASGQAVDLSNIDVDSSEWTDFQRRVLAACRRIPRGSLRTYGQLAADSGSPAAARAVGRVMATNPLPIVIPCHRVVGSAGELRGFSARGGLNMKERMMRLEGAASSSRRKAVRKTPRRQRLAGAVM